ncbi:hypothetical protein [Sulfurimonas sp.]|uniref:hypothetical protein n=1 Tax=Sulfurimonas sp. TaxID=2022749 RepID=UPI003D1089C1
METLKIKHYLTIIFMILTLTSCSNGEEKMDIIAYGTPEFEEFVKNAPISLDEAWEIQLDFYKNNPKKMEYSLYKQNSVMYFIVDNYYVYTLRPLMKTKPKGELINGIWVNSVSGEVKYNNNNITIEAESFIGYSK